MIHIPVLLQEVITGLNPQPGQKFIDGTAGMGGHTDALAERVKPNGKILAIEWDNELAHQLEIKYQDSNVKVIQASYVRIKKIAQEYGFEDCNGVLLDLGFSSWHIEEAGRGFSFERDEPLDMRYNAETRSPNDKIQTATEILNTYPEEELARIFKEYGEEKFDGHIARAIVDARKRTPITRTLQLVEIIREVVPFLYRSGDKRHYKRIHFATRVFQALRIEVNHELENVKKGLDASLESLTVGGRLAVITFHSLEDRIVKQSFREYAKRGTAMIVTKKPVRPSWSEIIENRRARSAKLRIIEKINGLGERPDLSS